MAEKFYKVRFTNGDESTAGLVVKKSQIENMSVSDISRLFPYSEARKMKRLEQSPQMSSFDEAFYYDFDKQGVYAPKKNPTTRKTAARTQRAAEAYVRRPSQITKKAPSKRLKKRRTVNLQSPRGVFPNPKTRSSLEKTSSWVIRNKKTGEVIMETFDIKKVNALNTAKYEAVPILKYLQELNSGIKKNPSSVHFDIDVNSHNARGAKAKTRVNPVARKKIAGLKNFIIQESAFSDTTGFKTVAVFAKVDESFEYAKARDAKNRSEGKRRWIKVLEG